MNEIKSRRATEKKNKNEQARDRTEFVWPAVLLCEIAQFLHVGLITATRQSRELYTRA